MTSHVVRVTYRAPSDSMLARFRVRDLRAEDHERSVTVLYDATASNPSQAAAVAGIRRLYEVENVPVEYGGTDGCHAYYVVRVEDRAAS